MSVDITEFVEIDPSNVDAVFKAANGTDFLMIKQVADDDADDKGGKPDDDEDDKAEKAEFCGDATCEICIGRASKGKLSMAQRRRIPKSDFAVPEKAPESGSYPIHDKAHARNALSRVAQHGTPEEKARVRRAVASKFPGIGKGKKRSKKSVPSQQAGESKSFPAPSSLMEQTNVNDRHQSHNTAVFPNYPRPNIPDPGTINAEGEGGGDTAPDKELHRDEAGGQTRERVAAQEARQNASKAEDVDMKGDPMPKARDEATEAHGQAQAQTETNQRSAAPADHIRDQMTRQREQAQKAFKFKVKKGGKKKRKKNAPLEISGAMKQGGPERVLSVAHATKELDDMTGAEFAETLVSVLDARDARKADERKAKKSKKSKKAKKAEKKALKEQRARVTSPSAEEAAQEAAKSASPELLVSGIAQRVSDTMQEALKEQLAPLAARIKNVEDQPARSRPALNNLAGKEPVLRDQNQPVGDPRDPIVATKALEERFNAEKDPEKKQKLGGELSLARLTIAERQRFGTGTGPAAR